MERRRRYSFPSYTATQDYADPEERRQQFFQELVRILFTHPRAGRLWKAVNERHRRRQALAREMEEEAEGGMSSGEEEDEEDEEIPGEGEVPDLDGDEVSIASTELQEPWELDEDWEEPEEEEFEPATGPGSPIVLVPSAASLQQPGVFFWREAA